MQHQSLSSSVGGYVKAIWEVAGLGAASTKDISVRLSVAPASVTNMLRRLREMRLVEYERYRGASLTPRGRAEALRLVRRHRLIEAFLLEHLGDSWQGAHEEAECLEHAVSDKFVERLAELLGYPEHSPYGDPIPGTEGALMSEETIPLGEEAVGHRVRISKVSDEDASRLSHLGECGLVPGRLLSVKVAVPSTTSSPSRTRMGPPTRSESRWQARSSFIVFRRTAIVGGSEVTQNQQTNRWRPTRPPDLRSCYWRLIWMVVGIMAVIVMVLGLDLA